MNKLTAEKCRETIEKFKRLKEQFGGIAMESELSLQAYEIALPILEQQEKEATPHIDNDVWIEWKGGDQPVDDYETVEVRFRNGSVEAGEYAECYEWNHGYHDLSTTEVDIIAYRVIENDGREG